MIIVLGSRKGGVSKSTTVLNLAVAFKSRGVDLMVVDADPQRSIERWAESRNEAGRLPEVPVVCLSGNFTKSLMVQSQKSELILVDAAGHDSVELRAALVCADLAIFPFRPSDMDLETADYVRNLVDQAEIANPKLKSAALLSQCPTNAKSKEVAQTRDVLMNKGFHVLDSGFCDRKIYRDSVGEGLSAIEMPNSPARNSAAQEVENLLIEIESLLVSSEKKKGEKNCGKSTEACI